MTRRRRRELRNARLARHNIVRFALMLGLAACAPARPSTPRAQRHPLAGRIWDVESGRDLAQDELYDRLAATQVVLLGETHDNPSHHAWQAQIVRELISRDRRPTLVLEMVEVDEQPAIDAAIGAHPREPDVFAHAVAWDESGWPEFRLYRPIVAAALEAGLPLRAGNLPTSEVRVLAHAGLAGIARERGAALGIDRSLAPAIEEGLRREMSESHCGMLPTAALGGLVLAQRARDAQIAETIRAAGPRGAVAILGAGHARNDRGVPARLGEISPELSVGSVAFMEIDARARSPEEYAAAYEAERLPFDFVVFTERARREDPCKVMRRSHGHR